MLFCRLVIPGSQIANMPGTNAYTVKVTIRNFLGAVDDKSLTFSKKSAGVAPAIALPLGASVSYKITEGMKVPVALAAASVCANQQVGTAGSYILWRLCTNRQLLSMTIQVSFLMAQ